MSDVAISEVIQKAINRIDEYSLFSSKEVMDKIRIISKDYLSSDILSTNSLAEVLEQFIKVLKKSGDNHSHIYHVSLKKFQASTNEIPIGKIIENCEYINVPTFVGSDENEVLTYAETVQGLIKSFDKDEINGYIVDLTHNEGGNMEPMILGLGPLYSDDVVGGFRFKDGSQHNWGYKSGSYLYEEELTPTLQNAYTISKRKPVAVLVGENTASSGEMVAVSFRENFKTVIIGTPTAGLLTGVQLFTLTDELKLALATSVTLDRKGVVYDNNVVPDVLCEENDLFQTASRFFRRI